MSTPKNDLRGEIRSLREKHSYFLMSAAGASVGFAITQMNNLTASQSNILLLVALVLWAFSFYSGHRFLMKDEGLLWANHAYLEELDTPQGQAFGQERMRGLLKKATLPSSKAAERWRKMQMACLVFGAALFVLWKLAVCDGCFENIAF